MRDIYPIKLEVMQLKLQNVITLAGISEFQYFLAYWNTLTKMI